MRHSEQFAVLFLPISFFIYLPIRLPIKPTQPWKGYLEVDLLTLDPKIFENIQDFFKKFKDLLSQLKACGVDKLKEEKQMVLTILSKLGPELFIFVSTFHTVRFTSGAT